MIEMKVTYVGHATFLIEYEGMAVLTDPMFSQRITYSTIRRRKPPKPKFVELPDIDAILISHWHFDHLDVRTLKKFDRKIPILINETLRKTPKRMGFEDVRALNWWEDTMVSGLKISAVPAYHFSGRPPFFTQTNYQGYVIEKESEPTVYFSGDTGLGNDFSGIGKKFDIGVAILPIGAYRPKSFRKHHLSPEDALEAKAKMDAKVLIPCHFGVFNLSWEPMDEPPKRLMSHARERGIEKEVALLNPGESYQS
jgi:L-ascorbate metabolism protein UlaG (beta-lactamase superfamily)